MKRVVNVPSSTEILEAWEKIENNLRERFNSVGGNYNPTSGYQGFLEGVFWTLSRSHEDIKTVKRNSSDIGEKEMLDNYPSKQSNHELHI